jgi:Domain of unknown function (DUF4412)
MPANTFKFLVSASSCLLAISSAAVPFEGRIDATLTRGTQTEALLYTVGTNSLRLEITATNWPNPVDVFDRDSGTLMLLFPNNRSFVRLPRAVENSSSTPPGMPSGFSQTPGALPPGGLPPGVGPANFTAMPAMPNRPALPAGLPPGVGPQAQSATPPGVPATANMAAMGRMRMMGGMPAEKMELNATGEKTNLLGFACEKFVIKQRGETMAIWATDQLPPFENYVRNQPSRSGPQMIQEQWPGMLKARHLFPLLATLKFDSGAELSRFEVKSITPEEITDADGNLFQPPPGYQEIQPLPF